MKRRWISDNSFILQEEILSLAVLILRRRDYRIFEEGNKDNLRHLPRFPDFFLKIHCLLRRRNENYSKDERNPRRRFMRRSVIQRNVISILGPLGRERILQMKVMPDVCFILLFVFNLIFWLEIVSKYEREHEVESEEEDDALRNSYENMLRLVWKQLIKRWSRRRKESSTQLWRDFSFLVQRFGRRIRICFKI